MKGWHKESYRHYLAAKGIKTKKNSKVGLFVPATIDWDQRKKKFKQPEIRVWWRGSEGATYKTFDSFDDANDFIKSHPGAEKIPLIAMDGYEINIYDMKKKKYMMAKSEILGHFNSKIAVAENQSNKLNELDKMDDAKTFLEKQTAKSLESGDITEKDRMDIMDKASSKYDEAYDDVTDQNKYFFNKEEYEDYKKMNDKYKNDSNKESFNDTWKRLETKDTDLMGLPRTKNVKPILDFEEAEQANLGFFDWAPAEKPVEAEKPTTYMANKWRLAYQGDGKSKEDEDINPSSLRVAYKGTGRGTKTGKQLVELGKSKFYTVDDEGDIVVRKEAVTHYKLRKAAREKGEESLQLMNEGKTEESKLAQEISTKLMIRADEMEHGRGTRSSKWFRG